MNKYKEFKNIYQKQFNALPLHFAFSEKRFEEELHKMGLDPNKKEDLDKLVSIQAGGFMLEEDVPKLKELYKKHDEEYAEKQKDMEFMYEAFIYEMANYEYGYTYDDSDFLEALGITQKELALNKELQKTLDRAKRNYLAKCT